MRNFFVKSTVETDPGKRVTVQDGTFDHTGIEDGVADLIVMAQVRLSLLFIYACGRNGSGNEQPVGQMNTRTEWVMMLWTNVALITMTRSGFPLVCGCHTRSHSKGVCEDSETWWHSRDGLESRGRVCLPILLFGVVFTNSSYLFYAINSEIQPHGWPKFVISLTATPLKTR